MKKKVVVLFGGVSSEHEVSRVSAACAVENLPDDCEALPIGITKDGRWLYFPGSTDEMRSGAWEQNEGCCEAIISPDRSVHGIMIKEGDAYTTMYVDVVLPWLHGRNGEDGTVQGLLEISGIPYVGCGVLASSTCMDKIVTNTLFDAAGVPHCRWDWMTTADIDRFDEIEARLAEKLHYPIFVKPANAGSSVGVTKATDKEQLRAAVELAAWHDDRIVFEEAVVGHEVECAVMGNAENGEASLLASTPGEVLAAAEFYDYDAKYVSSESKTVIPAHIEREQLMEVRRLARKAYTALGCSGLSRCDFFVREDGTVLINEINTLPGFTPISMYPKLMAHEGIACRELLCKLIALAEERSAHRKAVQKRSCNR